MTRLTLRFFYRRIDFACRLPLRHNAFAGSGQFAFVAARNALLRLFMLRFARQLLTFQSRLARLEARFRLGGALRLKIDGAQFRLLLAVVLHQRNIARADPGAGAALNAVVNMVGARFIVIAALAVPVELLRQQIGRAGVGARGAANTGLLLVVVAHFAGGWRENAVGDLHHRHVKGRQGKAHQRATHNHHLTRRGGKADLVQQMADRGADAAPDVARLRNRLAGQGYNALGQRLAVNHRALHRPGGADILHQHADIGRASAVRHFHPGKNFGQLLRTTGGIFGGDHADVQIALAAQRLLQRGDRFRLVIFNADQHALGLQHPGEDTAAFQHLGGVVLHQAIVGGDIGLALGGVDNQGLYAAQPAAQFSAGGEARAAKTGDARVMNALHNSGAFALAVVRHRLQTCPTILAVRRHKNAQLRQPRGMRGHMLANGVDGAGGRRMHRQHAAGAEGQRLATQHAIARRNANLAFMTDMLLQRNNKMVRQRQLAQRRAVRLGFHLRRMNAALEIPELFFTKDIQQIKHDFLPGSPVQEWFQDPTSSWRWSWPLDASRCSR